MKYSGKLELTWVNKDKETQIKPRILIEEGNSLKHTLGLAESIGE